MRATYTLAAALAFAGLATQGAEPNASDPFPKLQDLKAPILLEKDPEVSVDKHGNYLVNGKPRFLVGAQVGEGGLKHELLPTPGYCEELKWLYEDVPVYENAQRAGLDSVSYFTSDGWIKDSVWKGFKSMRTFPEDEALLERLVKGARLPLYVDYSCMPYWHGMLATPASLKTFKIPEEALNAGGYEKEANHWVPYSVTNPEGRKLYKLMWQAGARQVVEAGANALFYELFNEPAYDDPSPYNRSLFVERLKGKYGTLEKLNSLWRTRYASFEEIGAFKSRNDNPALLVEWCEFMEDCFVDVCKFGIEAIKEVDKRPGRAFCVQSMGMDFFRILPNSNVNQYKLSKILNCVSLPTGGGIAGGGMTVEPVRALDAIVDISLAEGMVQRGFFRAVGEGKPIHDGEAYIGNKRERIANHLWLQLTRGGNAVYAFQWSKRAWDSRWRVKGNDGEPVVDGKSAEGGRKTAEIFPYKLLNPYAADAAELTGTLKFKEELYKVDDIFVPRENRPPSQVALLISFPTERYSQASGNPAHNEIRSYGAALEFAHYAPEILPEEDLAAKLPKYKVLLAGGVENVYAGSVKPLKDFVSAGGTLVLGLEAMSLDELGNPVDWGGALDLGLGAKAKAQAGELSLSFERAPELPGALKAKLYRNASPAKAWEAVGAIGETPAVFRKAFGKGEIYWIDARLPEYALAALLGGILEKRGIKPLCSALRSSDGQLSPNLEISKAVAGAFSGYFLYNWDKYPKLVKFSCPETLAGAALADPVAGTSFKLSKGVAEIALGPNAKAVMVCAPEKTLVARFGSLPQADSAEAYAKLQESAKAVAAKKEFRFPVDAAKALPLDLKPFANSHFEDGQPNDGKGGWTDQGENCLRGTESIWGRQVFCGVPFDIIRYDMNAGKSCVVLGSKSLPGRPEKVEGIPVGEKAKALYFLQATAWTKGGEKAMSYVLRHPDGSTTVVPVVCGKNVADWWLGGERDRMNDAAIAWRNSENKGFYVWRWENPSPEKPIESIDIVSAGGEPIPIVVGITLERP